jgi:hypothetical protein
MKKKKYFIGCDPEIRFNYDKYEIEYHLSGKHIGHDHCNKIIEFRPDAGKPIQVTSNMAYLVMLFKKFVKKENYDLFLTGGTGSPSTGGHVHFDYGSEEIINRTINIMAKWSNKFNLLRTEPGRDSREKQGYGNYLDKRINAPTSFEWRAPSSWLSDPRWTYCMLTIGWVAEKNLDTFEKSLDSWKKHIRHIKQYLTAKEWKMFYPYYNMWYSYANKNKYLPNFINIDKWEEWLKIVPAKIKFISKKALEQNEFEITYLINRETGKSVLVKSKK